LLVHVVVHGTDAWPIQLTPRMALKRKHQLVLKLRPKLLKFHMSGPATHPQTPHRKAWRRERKEFIYITWDRAREETESALSSPSATFRYRHEL
jgi:hypothetical protein